jgi:DNA-binding NarL/FixJ family response regulator
MGVRLMIAVPPLFREGIRKILESKKYIKIVAEASTHQEIIPLVEKKKPDVLFLDTIICDLNILKLLQSIGGKSPKTKMILLTHTQHEEAIAADAISLCVPGYLTAASDATHLIHAIGAASKDKIRAEKKIITRRLVRLLPAGRGKLGFLESRPIKGRGEHKTRVISAIK